MGHLKIVEPRKRPISSNELAQMLLKEELEKELEAQTIVRSALEKAINSQPLFHDPTYKSLPQPDENLIKEIAILELEVIYLEKYLLSMYRRNFAKRLSTLPTLDQRPLLTNLESSKCNNILEAEDSGIYRSLSSLSQHSACSVRASPPFEAFDSYHSLPLSMLERTKESASNASNLQECIGSSFQGRDCETPNWLSEEMIKCISTVYCHLSDPPLFAQGLGGGDSSFNSWMNNPFSVETSKESSGSFFKTVEIQGILRESQRLDAAQELLQNYKSLICRLGKVDPGKLKHEEKLAFWINVHNSLVMHAFIVYGIPRGNVKRISLVLKAAYNIGGQTVSIDTIQSCILRCRLPRPTLWLNSLFFPKKKLKSGDSKKGYAVKQPEPRLLFALCSGFRSDPLVRLYTAKTVFQELEMAKEEYIEMNVKLLLHKEQRLMVPKNVEYFVKEMGLSSSGVAEMLEHSMPHSLSLLKQGKLWKKVEWIPHDFAFRFLLSNQLVQ